MNCRRSRRVEELVSAISGRATDAVAFPSAPQYAVCSRLARKQCGEPAPPPPADAALAARAQVAAVGPVVADELRERGCRLNPDARSQLLS